MDTTYRNCVGWTLLVIAANFVLARQQAIAAERKYKVEIARALREEKLAAFSRFTAAARVLETSAVEAYRQRRDVDVDPAVWEEFWNAHSDLDIRTDEATRGPLLRFAHRLAAAAHNENADEEVWSYVSEQRIAWRSAMRQELDPGIGMPRLSRHSSVK